MASIHWRGFFTLDGPLIPEELAGLHDYEPPLPPSYVVFLERFGGALLFRNGLEHTVEVLRHPECYTQGKTGDHLLRIGRGGTKGLFVSVDGGPEGDNGQWILPRPYGVDFAGWLRNRCRQTRKEYTSEEWRRLMAGARPFNEKELGVVAARRLIDVKMLGKTDHGTAAFEVRNNSNMVLPYFTVGLTMDHIENGGAWLDISRVNVGTTAVVEHKCYLDLHPRDDVRMFAMPDPEPEDREYYWEFKWVTPDAWSP